MSSPEHDDAQIEQAAKAVATGLSQGRPKTSIVQDLMDDGWGQSEAQELVVAVEQAVQGEASGGGGSGAWGWLIWIGALLLINFLSWVFDWPFWVY